MEDWLLHVDVFLNQQDDVEDKAKYGALIGALPTSVIASVQHVLADPPATNRYKALTAALRKRYVKEDDESNYQQLINVVLGDMLPSELLTDMKRLNGRRIAKLPCSVIRSMHLTKLPAHIQVIVDAVGSGLDDEQYATLADKVLQRHCKQQLTVNVISDEQRLNDVHAIQKPEDSEVQELRHEVRRLQAVVEKLSITPRPQESARRFNEPVRRFNEPARRLPDSARRIPEFRNQDICYYHSRFGNRAYNCQQPCNYNQGNGRSGGP